MTTSADTAVIVSTRFSRTRTGHPALAGNRPYVDLIYEGLSALAESLDCLAQVLLSLPEAAGLDKRIAVLQHRTALLEAHMQFARSKSTTRSP